MQALYDYLNKKVSQVITEEDFDVIRSHFTYKKLRKRQFFLEEGEICRSFAFIVKGAMRQYYIDEKGVEYTINLFVEDWWAGDRESFVEQTPSAYYLDAWESCEVLLITREDTLKLCAECPAFNEMLLKLDERNNIATQKRITSTISLNAEMRYQYFVDNYPFFLNRFPQHIIASFLGITKDTLSRIRKKMILK
jgi:CRP-like cAMP-binding protein